MKTGDDGRLSAGKKAHSSKKVIELRKELFLVREQLDTTRVELDREKKKRESMESELSQVREELKTFRFDAKRSGKYVRGVSEKLGDYAARLLEIAEACKDESGAEGLREIGLAFREMTDDIIKTCEKAAESTVLNGIPSEDDKGEPKARKSLADARILMCEDHELSAQVVMNLLKSKHMTTDYAANGKIGLELFKKSEPGTYQCVLMDIHMPEMDGLKATEEIRKSNHPDAQTIPIIALTADSIEYDIQFCRDAGMNEYLSKPVDPGELFEMLAKHILD